MLGSFDHVTRRLIVHTSPTKRSSDFVAHLEQLDQLYGPKPGQFTKPVVLVLDNGPIHTSKLSLAALASRAHWLTVEWLPKYAPELNDIEGVWRDLKAHHLAHQTFADADALNTAIHQAVDALNLERTPLPLVKLRISAWFLSSSSPSGEGLCRVLPAQGRKSIGGADQRFWGPKSEGLRVGRLGSEDPAILQTFSST